MCTIVRDEKQSLATLRILTKQRTTVKKRRPDVIGP